jgi:hypothetical protein
VPPDGEEILGFSPRGKVCQAACIPSAAKAAFVVFGLLDTAKAVPFQNHATIRSAIVKSERLPTGHGMNSLVSATRVRFDSDSMWVDLSDGRTLGVPLARFPRLLRATAEQREQVRISSRGLHWESLDEDVSIAGLLAGLGDQTATDKTFAA